MRPARDRGGEAHAVADADLDGDRAQASGLPAERRLRRRQPGDRHAVGRAGDVVEADLLAEGDRGRIAAVLAADAELDVRPRRAAALGGDADQLADARPGRG